MSSRDADRRDEIIARVALGAVVVGGLYVLVRSRRARQFLQRGIRLAAFTWLPAYVTQQVREAWAASRPPVAAGGQSAVATPAIPALDPPVSD
jgi:hypothetical protein